MLDRSLSIRSILVWIISLFGVLSLLIALVTGNIYRDITLENQRESLERLLEIASRDLLNESRDIAVELGMSLQNDSELRRALRNNDQETLTNLLENQFHQLYVTAHLIEMYQLAVYNSNLQPVARFTNNTSSNLACSRLIADARQRHGPERLKMLDRLCNIDGISYHSILIPVGGLKVSGYIEITASAAHFLKNIELTLGNPITISHPNGNRAFQSDSWPEESSLNDVLTAEYRLRNDQGETALLISMVNHIKPLREHLSTTRIYVIAGASGATLLAILIALLSLHATTLKPLTQLKKQIHLLRKDPIHMRKSVEVKGTEETRELAESFNQMTSELHSLYESLQNMAYRDKLTDLPNRNFFHAKLDVLTQSSESRETPFILLIFDLDRFKVVNDTLGHHIGDYLLNAVAARFKQALRTSDSQLITSEISNIETHEDIVARIGGDEFAVIIPSASDEKTAKTIARKLINCTRDSFLIEGNSLNIGLSIGICLHPQDGADMHTLMRHADIAMYHAKSHNSGFAFYKPYLEKQNQTAIAYESELTKAITNDEFELFFQPKLNARLEPIGAEALIRWFHPEMGMVPPDQFICVAERTGLIHPITYWVIGEALECCLNWQSEYPGLGVSVNISAISLQDPELIETIETLLRQYPLKPALLTLELTETAIMTQPEQALTKLNQLSDMGLTISMDDFGTGYSSLSYLKKIPVDEIKIDRSFVMDMAENSDDKIIVNSIISLAHSMSLSVVAEGVETLQISNSLTLMGCDTMQGYYFSKPLPINDFLKWLNNQSCQENTLALS